jgi:putative flippase GtrA
MPINGLGSLLRAPWAPAAVQFCRYALIGVLTNSAAYLLYLGLTLRGLEPKLAATGTFAVALIAAFFLNRKLTFRSTSKLPVALQRYLVSYGIAYLIDIAVLDVFVTHLGYPHELVQLVMTGVNACGLFVAQRYWVFGGDTAFALAKARRVQSDAVDGQSIDVN